MFTENLYFRNKITAYAGIVHLRPFAVSADVACFTGSRISCADISEPLCAVLL